MDNKKVAVIGDCHGCYKTLIALVAQIPKDTEIVFVGDLIDRGPMSMEVVEFIKSNDYKCVMGNHEQALIDFFDIKEGQSRWEKWSHFNWLCKMGGSETFKSYGIDTDCDFIPMMNSFNDNIKLQEHLAWMRQLPYYLEFTDVKNPEDRSLVVSHSSVHNVWHLKDTNSKLFKDTVAWGRRPDEMDAGVFSVFGHTSYNDNPRIHNNYANIDTGCCFKNEKESRYLTALSFPDMILYKQQNIE